MYHLLLLFSLFTFSSAQQYCIHGNAIEVCGSQRVAGAIDSLIWNNYQFINAFDHGRELQIAITNQSGECYNPTEAGSMNDGTGDKTTSVMQGINITGNIYRTTTLPAFWLVPGQIDPGNGCKAVNKSPLSNYKTSKSITIGAYGVWNSLQYLISVDIPEHNDYIQVEAPTGYMPVAFNTFWTINLANGQLTSVSQENGEVRDPVIISTTNGQFAMGAYLAKAPVPYVHYAKFFFPSLGIGSTSKWSVVFRDYRGVQPGQVVSFEAIICVGTLQDVQNCMVKVAPMSEHIICTEPQC